MSALREAVEAAAAELAHPALAAAALEADLAGLPEDRQRLALPAVARALALELSLAGPDRQEAVLRAWPLRARLRRLGDEAGAAAHEVVGAPTIPAAALRQVAEVRQALAALREEARAALPPEMLDALEGAFVEVERSCACVETGGDLLGGREVIDVLERALRPPGDQAGDQAGEAGR